MFRPSRNFKVPQVSGGQWKNHQTFQKWDPISKRLVTVNCCLPPRQAPEPTPPGPDCDTWYPTYGYIVYTYIPEVYPIGPVYFWCTSGGITEEPAVPAPDFDSESMTATRCGQSYTVLGQVSLFQFMRVSGSIGSDPGSGHLTTIPITPPSVVSLQFSKTDNNSSSAATYLSTIASTADTITITKDINTYATFTISSSTEYSTYWGFTCVIVSQSGTVSLGDIINLTYTVPSCTAPDPVDSATIDDITGSGADVSWTYSGTETLFEVKLYESATSPVNTSSTPVFNQEGSFTSPYSASFTPQENYYYVASVRVKNGCGSYSTYVYSTELQYTVVASGWTFTARDSNRSWTGVASSNSGTKLVACVSGGQIYTSTNSGVSWTARDSNRLWAAVASSSDGTKLVACVSSGQIYTSTDSGATWTARDSNRSWRSVASSSDGTKLVAAESGGLYTSSDSGANWTSHETSRIWMSVASSSDGTKLIAAESGGRLFTSTDSGANWTMGSMGSKSWVQVASSADGSILVGVASFDTIYVSTDSGATWNGKDSSRDWYGVTCSSDGSVMAAVVNTGQIYISQDTGNTWTAYESNRNWQNNCIALSGTGNLLAAGVTGGKMYIGLYEQTYQYILVSGSIGTNPGSGNFSTTVTTPPNVVLQFNKTDKNSLDASSYLSTISGSANTLIVTKDLSNYSIFSITGSTDLGAYWSFSCAIVSFLGIVNTGDTVTVSYS